MQTNYCFLKVTEGIDRIMYVKIPTDYNAINNDLEYKKLNNLLESYYPGSEFGIMFDKKFIGYNVIVFENAEDCSAFALVYGHIYGK